MKNFCIVLHHRSPTAYRFLRKFFNLPHVSTLYRHIDNNISEPGFSESIEKALKQLVYNIDDNDKEIMICWDEISLKKIFFILLQMI